MLKRYTIGKDTTIKRVNEIIVTDNKENNAHKYGVYFNITSINDEIINGSVNL